MFDSGEELPALAAGHLAGLIEQNHAELMARECRVLQLACAWADAHYLDSGSDEYQPLIKRACAWGGEGTPQLGMVSIRKHAGHRHYGGAGVDR